MVTDGEQRAARRFRFWYEKHCLCNGRHQGFADVKLLSASDKVAASEKDGESPASALSDKTSKRWSGPGREAAWIGSCGQSHLTIGHCGRQYC